MLPEPGTNYIYNTQVTIFEALSQAGDANLSANRSNVRLVRQVDGKSYLIKLDLTDPKIIESPYYFLLPNDAIYVETSKENLLKKQPGFNYCFVYGRFYRTSNFKFRKNQLASL